ncbi:MAG: endolytic transglycosylase MltG [Mycobacteriales bacterium]
MSLLEFAPEIPADRGRRTGRTVVALFAAIALLVVVAGYGVVRLRGTTGADYPGPGYGTVYVYVAAGDTATAIGATLYADGVVASIGAFRGAAEHDPKSTGIEPGYYALRLHMSAREALVVLENPANLLHSRVTVPEGTSLKQLLPLLAAHTEVPLAALRAAVAEPGLLGLPPYADGHVEGFLFPATYEVPPGTTAVGLLSMMTARFADAADQVNLVAGAAALGRTPLQVVIIASILERESAGPADDPMAAEVFYNRLRAGMPLGSQFTYAYAGGDPASPYNTYTHVGFPPGPYDSPGAVTLSAALHPAAGPWRYFITLPDGHTLFAVTDAQFAADRQLCLNQGGC